MNTNKIMWRRISSYKARQERSRKRGRLIDQRGYLSVPPEILWDLLCLPFYSFPLTPNAFRLYYRIFLLVIQSWENFEEGGPRSRAVTLLEGPFHRIPQFLVSFRVFPSKNSKTELNSLQPAFYLKLYYLLIRSLDLCLTTIGKKS